MRVLHLLLLLRGVGFDSRVSIPVYVGTDSRVYAHRIEYMRMDLHDTG